MREGQTVYTVNAKTNTVDSWTYSGHLKTRQGLQLLLTNGKKSAFLPANAVYESELQARFIADSYR